MDKLLEVKDLYVDLQTEDGNYELIKGVSFHINRGESFGVVGESGCGKSLTALSIMGLLPKPPLEVKKGEISFQGDNLLKLSDKQMQKIRGKEISMIFQEPMTALDPLFKIGDQIKEALEIHENMKEEDMDELVLNILKRVGIPRPDKIVNEYPHQLSGGMLQRIMIAIAMILKPKLLIADEPTTALDVTIQAQILDLMNELKKYYDTSLMMITHDLGVIAETCDRVAVFYGGQIVEQADVVSLFYEPKHPYTQGLMKSINTLGDRDKGLYSIPGVVPTVDQFADGCRFADRCHKSKDICFKKAPELKDLKEGHKCRCWLFSREEI